MDAIGIIGFLIALAALLVGQHLEGGQWESLANLPAFIIVFGGTLGAVIVETPYYALNRAISILKWVIYPPSRSKNQITKNLVAWSRIARKEGFLALEGMTSKAHDPFTAKGLQMLVDGHDAEVIKDVLEQEIDSREDMDRAAANVYESMGGYSPTIGIIGAVLGLIQVLGNLTEPDKLGAGIAVAFIATVYGIAFANFLFLPIAKRLQSIIIQESSHREMILEGILSISRGENPRHLEEKLKSFRDPL